MQLQALQCPTSDMHGDNSREFDSTSARHVNDRLHTIELYSIAYLKARCLVVAAGQLQGATYASTGGHMSGHVRTLDSARLAPGWNTRATKYPSRRSTSSMKLELRVAVLERTMATSKDLRNKSMRLKTTTGSWHIPVPSDPALVSTARIMSDNTAVYTRYIPGLGSCQPSIPAICTLYDETDQHTLCIPAPLANSLHQTAGVCLASGYGQTKHEHNK